jgi:serine/threonine-protein kinase
MAREQSIIDELKRRRVLRVVLVYTASAFAVLQGAQLIVTQLQLPSWILTALLVIALLGVPAAAVLAWLFDITPEGVQRARHEAGTHRWLSPRAAAVIAVAFIATASMAWYAGRVGARSTNIEDAKRSIAVLPFANVSDRAEDVAFSDGLADELLNLLGRINGLKVAARTSAFAFRDRTNDIRAIGDSLGVQTVLEGSVRRAGPRVRVTATLINVADGMRMWSHQYDDDLTNIFQVQERLARAIASQLELRLGDAVASRSAVDVEALDLYLAGLDRFRQRGESLRVAIDYFERAIAVDPTYAEAYGGLAMAYAVLPGWDTVSTQWAAERTRYAAQRAIDLDDRLPEPYAALCQSLALSEWKWAEAEEACNAAIRRNGSFAIAHAWLGELLAIEGRFGESRIAFDRALMLDGYSGVVHQMAGMAAVSERDLPRGSALLERSVELGLESSRLVAAAAAIFQNDEARARDLLAPIVPAGRLDMFLEAARNSEVRAAVAEAADANVDRRWPNWAVENARTFAFIGDAERTLKYLQLAFDRHEFTLASQLHSPFFDFLRWDARFQSLVRAMGLDPDAAIRANVMQLSTSD